MNIICENKMMYRVHCIWNIRIEALIPGITVPVFSLESQEDHFTFLCLDLHAHTEAG